MRKLLIFLFVSLSVILSAQPTVYSTFNGYADLQITGTGPTYNFSISNFNGTSRNQVDGPWQAYDIAVGDVVWADCARFIVTNVVTSSFATAMLEVQIPAQDVLYGFTIPIGTTTRCAIVREIAGGSFFAQPPPADGNNGALSGVDNSLYACMSAHYATYSLTTYNTINEIWDYTGTTGVAPAVLASDYPGQLWKNSVGEVFYSDGTSWLSSGSEVKLTNVQQEGVASGIFKLAVDTLGTDTLYVANNGVFRRFQAGGNVITDATLAGIGTSGNPLRIAQQGATTNKILRWNGTTWLPANADFITSVSNDTTFYYPYNDNTNWDLRHTNSQTIRQRIFQPVVNQLTYQAQVVPNSLDSFYIKDFGVRLRELNQSGAATGQVPTWNGTQWVPQNPTVYIGSLNGLTSTTQTFANDANVTITSSGSTHTLGWSGLLPITRGGTGLGTLGTANQLIRVNSGGTALEYFTPTYISSAITSLNGLTGATQTFSVGTTGTNFNISSVGTNHQFNIPIASGTNTGLLSNTDWTTFNNKPSGTGANQQVTFWTGTSTQSGNANFLYDYTNGNLVLGGNTFAGRFRVNGAGSTSGTWTAQFHNSTGTNNALMIRDDGALSIGFATPDGRLRIRGLGATNATKTLLVENSAGNVALTILDDRSIQANALSGTGTQLATLSSTGVLGRATGTADVNTLVDGVGVTNQWAFWSDANTIGTSNILLNNGGLLDAAAATGFGVPNRSSATGTNNALYSRSDRSNSLYYNHSSTRQRSILTGQEFNSTAFGDWTASRIDNPELYSIMYGLDGTRWTIANSGSTAAGDTYVRTYTLNKNSLTTPANNGITSPAGAMYFGFWYGNVPQAISVRLRRGTDNTYFGPFAVTMSNINTSSGDNGFQLFRIDFGSSFNWLDQIEVTITNPVAATLNWQYLHYIPASALNDFPTPYPIITQLKRDNVLYGGLAFYDGSATRINISRVTASYFNTTGGNNNILGVGTSTPLNLTALTLVNPVTDNNSYYGLRARTVAGLEVLSTRGDATVGVGRHDYPVNNRLWIQGLGTTSGTNSLAVHNSTGTSNSFIIRDDGNSAFGSLPGTTKLTVYGTNGTVDGLTLDANSSTPTCVVLKRNGTTVGYAPAIAITTANFASDALAGDMIFRTESNRILFSRGSASSSLAINGNNVGVRNVNPTQALDIKGQLKVDTLTATPNRIGGWSSGNVATAVTLGTNLSLSGNVLNATGGITLDSLFFRADSLGGFVKLNTTQSTKTLIPYTSLGQGIASAGNILYFNSTKNRWDVTKSNWGRFTVSMSSNPTGGSGQAFMTQQYFSTDPNARLTLWAFGSNNDLQLVAGDSMRLTATNRIIVQATNGIYTSAVNTLPTLNTTKYLMAFDSVTLKLHKIDLNAMTTGQVVTWNGSAFAGSTPAKMREETFTATASQTSFTIAYSAPAVSGTSIPVRVYRNGIRLNYVASGPNNYQFTYSGTTITTSACVAGDLITVEYLN